MIISRTPFRISFVGGGTDLRSFYSEEPGQVLSTSIDKFIYVVVKRQIGIVENKYRINWSKVEFCNEIEEIEHPIVRETFRFLKIDFPIEITTFADIPAQTGLGSSSAFTVGLLHALYALKGELITKYQLAITAAKIEVDILKRTMGKQDHFASTYGDLNVFTFYHDEKVVVEPVFYRPETVMELEKNMIIFYTKIKRNASDVLQTQNAKIPQKRSILQKMKNLVPELQRILSKGVGLNEIGEILHEGWELKQSITPEISNSKIDDYYERARKSGAIGGKLLGAGGGGFMLLYVEQQNKQRVIESLKELYNMPVGFHSGGSRITYYDQTMVN